MHFLLTYSLFSDQPASLFVSEVCTHIEACVNHLTSLAGLHIHLVPISFSLNRIHTQACINYCGPLSPKAIHHSSEKNERLGVLKTFNLRNLNY